MRDAPIQRFRLVTVAALLAPLAGCAAEAGADRRTDAASLAAGQAVLPTVSDSAGVRTMTHDEAAFDRAPRLELEPAPIAVLGAPDDDPAFDLTHVETVQMLRDGRFATRSAIGSRVLLFSADGRGARVLARQGQGPGEVMRPMSLLPVARDTLLVLDPGIGRHVWIPMDGGPARETPMSADTTILYVWEFPGTLASREAVAVILARPRPGTEGEVAWWPCRIALLPADGGRLREIASFPCMQTVTVETRRRGRRRLEDMLLRLGGRGDAAVMDSLVVTTAGDGYAVDLCSRDGAVAARIVADRPRRRVDGAMRDSVIARELDRLSGPREGTQVDVRENLRLAREQPFADSLPAYHAVLTARDGTLWIVDAIAPTDTAWSATAFRADGAIVGRLHSAVRGRPMAFEGDRVAVRQEDADGIVTVRIHRIRAVEAP